jgi:gliding motility-associated-like protein
VNEDYNITPNNILTPNGDGENDTWVIENIINYPDNEVMIFDRTGRILLKTKNYKNDWDATINNELLIKGTYYYVIKLGLGIEQIKGFITVIR